VRGESGKLLREMAFAALRAQHLIGINAIAAANQLLELRSAVVTQVFKDGHLLLF